MKKVLIISPHFPPSNLAAVHRSRLFAQHLPSFGWLPIILTVDEKYYEEKLDWDLHKLLPSQLRIEKVNAFKANKPRIIGDLGLRGFLQLYKRAKKLIRQETFDFLYIPIPSFYSALLGRWLHESTHIKYGIDYIDPWVHYFPGSDRKFSRHWFTTKLATILEPIAVKKASLITGVAEGYYIEVLNRNPQLKSTAISGAMAYGGEEADHKMVNALSVKPYLFEGNEQKLQMVYAGAMLPKAYKPLEEVFKAISENISAFRDAEFHFIGTGKSTSDPNSFNIKELAVKYGLWNSVVFEYPQRIPYVDVLAHINAAAGVFILGSTEPHYTPSKVYQAVLSAKPILALLHTDSTAVTVIQESNAGIVLTFKGEEELSKIKNEFIDFFNRYQNFCKNFDEGKINSNAFESYSAKAITEKLARLLDKAFKKVV